MTQVVNVIESELAAATFSMGDAAYLDGLTGTSFEAVAGYYGGPNAYHVWAPTDWDGLKYKLPIWVGGYDGFAEGGQAVNSLRALGVPVGTITALDLEGRVDKTYVTSFGQHLQSAGYKVWVYGSASSVFGNPELNGYWVADYAGIGPFMYNHNGVRATQYTSGLSYDVSLVKDWTLAHFWQ